MRKNFFIYGLLCLILINFTGCALFHNPFKSWKSAETGFTNAQSQVVTNQTKLNNSAQEFAYATDYSLNLDPTPSKYNQVAQKFNKETIIALGGIPTTNEIANLQETVSNLLSDNKKILEEGNKQLVLMNSQVLQLQNDKTNLNNKLTYTINKLEKVGGLNATLAEKWHKLTEIFWYSIYGIGLIFILKIVSIVLPPPYNCITYIISLPLSLIIKCIHALFPEIKEFCSLVDSGYKDAATDLVNGIQALKIQNPNQHSQISSTISATVNNSSIPIINSIKAENNIVS